MKINDKVRQLRRRLTKRQTGTGFLYRGKLPPANKKFKMITVHAIFVSNTGMVFLRPHVFGERNFTRSQWKDWLDRNYGTVLREGVLPHYQEQFGGFWRLHTMIGWEAYVNQPRRDSVSRKTRNKAKRKG